MIENKMKINISLTKAVLSFICLISLASNGFADMGMTEAQLDRRYTPLNTFEKDRQGTYIKTYENWDLDINVTFVNGKAQAVEYITKDRDKGMSHELFEDLFKFNYQGGEFSKVKRDENFAYYVNQNRNIVVEVKNTYLDHIESVLFHSRWYHESIWYPPKVQENPSMKRWDELD